MNVTNRTYIRKKSFLVKCNIGLSVFNFKFRLYTKILKSPGVNV